MMNSLRITLVKPTTAAKHDTDEILFTRYKHQNEKSTTRNHIVNELTRMLPLVSQHLPA